MSTRLLSGWGGATRSAATVDEPHTDSDVAKLVHARPDGRLIARGAGRSYGDAALNAGGHVADLRGLRSIGPIDERAGTITAGAGATLGAILARTIPAGWMLPVVPGTQHVTVGGAIASDVHGKNHRAAGSFAGSVEAFDLVTSEGPRVVDARGDPDLFWATAGGMGLTGVITGATLRLVPLRTPWFETVTWRTGVLGETLRILDRSAHQHAMAWLDPCAPPDRMGRGVITCGEPALAEAGHSPARRAPSANDGSASGPALGVMRPSLIRVASTSYWRMAAPGPTERTVRLEAFLFPFDRLGSWNRLFGPPRVDPMAGSAAAWKRGRARRRPRLVSATRGRLAVGLAQALRERQPGAAVVSHRRLDHRHRPSRSGARARGAPGAARLHHRTGGRACVPREGQQVATEHAAGDVSASRGMVRGPPARRSCGADVLRPRTPSPSARGRRMIDGTGIPDSVLVLGAGSAIAQSIVSALVDRGTTDVVLAARRPLELEPWLDSLNAAHREVSLASVRFDACDVAAHAGFLQGVWSDKRRFDLVLVAFGVMGVSDAADPHDDAVTVATTNYLGAVSILRLVATRMTAQGQGRVVVLSSAAAPPASGRSGRVRLERRPGSTRTRGASRSSCTAPESTSRSCGPASCTHP